MYRFRDTIWQAYEHHMICSMIEIQSVTASDIVIDVRKCSRISYSMALVFRGWGVLGEDTMASVHRPNCIHPSEHADPEGRIEEHVFTSEKSPELRC